MSGIVVDKGCFDMRVFGCRRGTARGLMWIGGCGCGCGGSDTSGMSEEEDVLRSANRCRVWVDCMELGLVKV